MLFIIQNFRSTVVQNVFYDPRVVEFATYKDMRRAIDKLDGTEINGRKIKLVEDSRNRKNR